MRPRSALGSKGDILVPLAYFRFTQENAVTAEIWQLYCDDR
jgi:hypothetical protein